jgi:hypothetical protein
MYVGVPSNKGELLVHSQKNNGQTLIGERNRLLKKHPGLQDSFSQFLESFKKYKVSVEKSTSHRQSAPPKIKFLKQ